MCINNINTMKCNRCGSENNADSRYCCNCGNTLKKIPPPPLPQQRKKSNNNKISSEIVKPIIFIVLVAVVAIIGLQLIRGGESVSGDNTHNIDDEKEITNSIGVENRYTYNKNNDFRWLSEQYIYPEDIEGYSAADLRILRNAIFARHNYIFKSADLREYFSQYSWYSPIWKDVSGQLNSIELHNIEILKNEEQTR